LISNEDMDQLIEDEALKQQDWSILRVSDKLRMRWDIYIILISLYTTITVPVDIAFKPEVFHSIAVTVVEAFIDLTFFVDIIINFRTTFISKDTGEEIYDSKLIAKKYLTGRFIIDFISSFPWEKLTRGESDILTALGLLKIVRLGRIYDVIMSLNTKSDFKAFLKVLWLIFSLFLYTHCIACLWYYIIIAEEVYVP
jgi:potassium voltage-gated channel Eag-related subfamily H member 2